MHDGEGLHALNLVIRWIARIWGTLIWAFVTFFLLAHIFGDADAAPGWWRDPRELITFLVFPVGTVIGLAMAWKWEGVGGLIVTLGMVIGLSTGGGHWDELFFSVGVLGPGVLYLLSWSLSRLVKSRE
jgi:hypothetical protein